MRVPLRNTGNHPTSFLGPIPTYKLLDLPKINAWCPWHADAPGMLGFADPVPLLGDAPGMLGSADPVPLV